MKILEIFKNEFILYMPILISCRVFITIKTVHYSFCLLAGGDGHMISGYKGYRWYKSIKDCLLWSSANSVISVIAAETPAVGSIKDDGAEKLNSQDIVIISLVEMRSQFFAPTPNC